MVGLSGTKMKKPGFWKKLINRDDPTVDPTTFFGTIITAIMMLLAIPVTILGMMAVYHHVWTLNKGLDNSVTTLLLGLAGGGGAGFGIGYGVSKLGSRPMFPDNTHRKAKPAPTPGEEQ